MTTTITLLCPEGIILAADSRETLRDKYTGEIISYKDKVDKILELSKNRFTGISCWGLAEIEEDENAKKDILPFLKEFESSTINEKDDVDSIAEKLKIRLENVTPPLENRMGFHVAGYVEFDGHKIPKLRHVFRTWHVSGNFTNENCHIEYYYSNGDKVTYKTEKTYPPLFNGDNFIANALFNYAPNIQPYFRIIPNLLTLEESTELAKLIVSTSIHRLNYFFDIKQFKKIPATVGGSAKIAKITENEGFVWIPET